MIWMNNDEVITEKIKGLRFKKRLFGCDELDVMRKLSEIDREYQSLLKAQKDYYEDRMRKLGYQDEQEGS